MGTDWWESLAHFPYDRGERFLKMVSYQYEEEFPVQGTDMTGSFWRPKDLDYTVVVVKVR